MTCSGLSKLLVQTLDSILNIRRFHKIGTKLLQEGLSAVCITLRLHVSQLHNDCIFPRKFPVWWFSVILTEPPNAFVFIINKRLIWLQSWYTTRQTSGPVSKNNVCLWRKCIGLFVMSVYPYKTNVKKTENLMVVLGDSVWSHVIHISELREGNVL